MDLIDLFIGAEGTLGVVTEVTLRVLPVRPGFCLALIPFEDRTAALTFAARLRQSAIEARRTSNACGIDASAIEHMDGRCLALVREDGDDRRNGVTLPPDAAIALLVTLEVPGETTAEAAFEQFGSWDGPDDRDTPITRFCALLAEHRVLDQVHVAVPGDRARAAQLMNLREAVPAGVNRRVGWAKQQVDARIEKTAADIIVPFERLEVMLDFYERELRRRGLDGAVWGHLSDGNLHPNVIPRSLADVESGKEAILAWGREAIRLNGAPLAEHGVGRNRTKHQLLEELYGPGGIEEMRRVKRAIDPAWKLAAGVLFSR
jgi:D-lactate dehydrogenase (cytochrome)